MLFLDLDRFKIINDSLGHERGDVLLVAAKGRVRRCLRAGDTLAASLGDEFTILVEDLHGTDDAIALAERIVSELNAPFKLDGNEVMVTASIGIAVLESADEWPGATAAQGRRSHVPGQGAGPESVRRLRRGHRAGDHFRVSTSRLSCARAARAQGVRSPLPTQPCGRHARAGRRRGARPLGAPGARPARARRVHLGHGGERDDRRRSAAM